MRQTLRLAVLAAVGACGAPAQPTPDPQVEQPAPAPPETPTLVTAPQPGPQGAIPELDAPTPSPEPVPAPVPLRAHLEESLRDGMQGWVASLRSTSEGERARALALLDRTPEIERLMGPPIQAKQEIWSPGRTRLPRLSFDLRTREGRADAVMFCLAMNPGSADPCDLSSLLLPEVVLTRAAGLRQEEGEPFLDRWFRWHNLVVTCENPVQDGECGAGFTLDARDASCHQGRACRYGRPLEGGRTAEWQGALPTAEAAAWSRVALLEHASIVAFRVHLAELEAVGAPAALVGDAREALEDERVHARLAGELVRHFGGDGSPGPLDPERPAHTALFDVLVGVARDGCLAETLSAAECAFALEATRDPAVRARLQVLSEDEARHAALAWRTLAWGLPRLPERQQKAVLAVFTEWEPPERPEVPEGIGIASGSLAWQAQAWALEHTVFPALRALAARAAEGPAAAQ